MHLVILLPGKPVLTIHVNITSFTSPVPPTSSCVFCLVYKLLFMYVFHILNIDFDLHYSTQPLCPLMKILFSKIHNLHPGTLDSLLPSMLQSRLISGSWTPCSS